MLLQSDEVLASSVRGSCEYFVSLETKAACPAQESVIGGLCSVVDPTSGFTYSLLPLKAVNNSYYNVSADRRSFKVAFVYLIIL